MGKVSFVTLTHSTSLIFYPVKVLALLERTQDLEMKRFFNRRKKTTTCVDQKMKTVDGTFLMFGVRLNLSENSRQSLPGKTNPQLRTTIVQAS